MPRLPKPGDRLNKFITTKWYAELMKDRGLAPGQKELSLPENPVKVVGRTTQGKEFNRFDPVVVTTHALHDSSSTEEDIVEYMQMLCTVDSPQNREDFCIAQGPINEDTGAPVTVFGITWAKFNHIDQTHQYLECKDNALQSGHTGRARILSTPPGNTYPREGVGLIYLPGPRIVDTFIYDLNTNWTTNPASASIYSLVSGTIDADADLYDTVGHWLGVLEAGDRGVCVRIGDAYYAISGPDQVGGGAATEAITFTLTQDLAAGDGMEATATVDDGSLTSGTVVTIRNTGNKKSWVGAKGEAIKVGTEWWLVEVNQYPILAEIVLSSNTHSLTPGAGVTVGSVANQIAITQSSFVSLSPYPFSFLPATAPTFNNPKNFLGVIGDKALVTYNSNTSQWELVALYPAEKKRIAFHLTADMATTTVGSITDAQFDVDEVADYLAGEAPAPTVIHDPMSLIIGGKNNHSGVAEYSYKDDLWRVVAFERQPVQLRISNYNFQISHDGGVTWSNWGTGEACP